MDILHAEDDPDIRSLMQQWAQQEFPTVELESVPEGESAYQQVSKGSYDYLITDCAMPQMTGVEPVEKLAEENWSMPIAFYTNHPNPTELREIQGSLATNVFIKGRDGCRDVLNYVVSQIAAGQPATQR